MGEIYAAKTNHITNPVGYALKPLVFSWKVKGCKGQEQRHARIVISKEPTLPRFASIRERPHLTAAPQG